MKLAPNRWQCPSMRNLCPGTRRRAALLLPAVAVTMLAAAFPLAARGATGSGWPATPAWAAIPGAAVHPGVQTITGKSQCTANFVFYDESHVYLGQAAHCSSTSSETVTDGCKAGSMPLGTPVQIQGASRPGTLVYNSWVAMASAKESNTDTCMYNDLALVRIDPADVSSVNPSVPFWGGPTGLNTAGPGSNAVYSYGNSLLRFDLSALSPKTGFLQGDTGNGWGHQVLFINPAVPGDSGSPVLDNQGRALGIVSALSIAIPGGLTNVVGDLAHEIAYMRAHSAFGAVELAVGTLPFDNGKIPLPIP